MTKNPSTELRHHPGPGLHLRMRASVEAVPRARRRLTSWLEELDLPPEVVDDMALAVTELVTNAVEASPSPAAEVSVTARFRRPDLSLEILDDGPGFTMNGTEEAPGPEAARGRGLPIVRALVDLVEVQRDHEHTKVIAIRRLDPEPL